MISQCDDMNDDSAGTTDPTFNLANVTSELEMLQLVNEDAQLLLVDDPRWANPNTTTHS